MSLKTSRIEITSFYKKAVRILKLSKKPEKSEVILISKITVTGTALLGFIAFILRIALNTILGV